MTHNKSLVLIRNFAIWSDHVLTLICEMEAEASPKSRIREPKATELIEWKCIEFLLHLLLEFRIIHHPVHYVWPRGLITKCLSFVFAKRHICKLMRRYDLLND